MAAGEPWAAAHPMPRLKVVATVGDPLSPEAWDWCRAQFGAACPVLDTWWQTETGGIVLAPWRSETGRPPAGSRPFFGVAPLVLRNDGQPADALERGNLCLAQPWPGMMTGIWCDAENVARFRASYFARFPGLYYTGDQASVDEDGRFHIEGLVRRRRLGPGGAPEQRRSGARAALRHEGRRDRRGRLPRAGQGRSSLLLRRPARRRRAQRRRCATSWRSTSAR